MHTESSERDINSRVSGGGTDVVGNFGTRRPGIFGRRKGTALSHPYPLAFPCPGRISHSWTRFKRAPTRQTASTRHVLARFTGSGSGRRIEDGIRLGRSRTVEKCPQVDSLLVPRTSPTCGLHATGRIRHDNRKVWFSEGPISNRLLNHHLSDHQLLAHNHDGMATH